MAKKAKKAARKAAKKPAKKAAKKVVKKAAKKVAKKAAPKKAAKKRKPNAAFMAALQPSALLSEVVGSKPLPRTEVIKKIWDYIKKNGLQDSKDKRQINADPKLEKVFGKKSVSMFEMNKHVSAHVK